LHFSQSRRGSSGCDVVLVDVIRGEENNADDEDFFEVHIFLTVIGHNISCHRRHKVEDDQRHHNNNNNFPRFHIFTFE
jgi:hypothetical protein